MEQKFQNLLHYFVPETDTTNIFYMDEQGFWMDSNGFLQSGTLILIDPEFITVFAYLLMATQFTSTEAILGKKIHFLSCMHWLIYISTRRNISSPLHACDPVNNNAADFRAVFMAIWMAKYHGITKLCIMMDSTYVIDRITACMHGWIQKKPLLSEIKLGENGCSVSSWKPWKISKSNGKSFFFTFMILSGKSTNFMFYFWFGLRLPQKPPISTTNLLISVLVLD